MYWNVVFKMLLYVLLCVISLNIIPLTKHQEELGTEFTDEYRAFLKITQIHI